jgi:hypothetical protein
MNGMLMLVRLRHSTREVAGGFREHPEERDKPA